MGLAVFLFVVVLKPELRQSFLPFYLLVPFLLFLSLPVHYLPCLLLDWSLPFLLLSVLYVFNIVKPFQVLVQDLYLSFIASITITMGGSYIGLRGNHLQVAIGVIAGMDFLLFGYDQGVTGGLLTLESFNSVFPTIATSGKYYDNITSAAERSSQSTRQGEFSSRLYGGDNMLITM